MFSFLFWDDTVSLFAWILADLPLSLIFVFISALLDLTILLITVTDIGGRFRNKTSFSVIIWRLHILRSFEVLAGILSLNLGLLVLRFWLWLLAWRRIYCHPIFFLGDVIVFLDEIADFIFVHFRNKVYQSLLKLLF